MNFSWTEIIILLAALHGGVLCVLIWHRRALIPLPHYLALLSGTISIILFNMVFGEKIWLENLPILSLLLSPLALVIGPLQYFYIKNILQNGFSFSRKTLFFHLLPFIMAELGWILSGLVTGSIRAFTLNGIYIYFGALNVLITFQALAYVWAILVIIARSAKNKKARHIQHITALKWIAYGGALGWLIFALENVFFFSGIHYPHQFDYASIWAAIYVYIFGYWGILNLPISPPAGKPSREKYARSGLSREDAEKIAHIALNSLIEGEYFKRSDLSLREFADILQINSHHLSQALNTVFEKNFFEFINEQRVAHVKRLMQKADYQNYTLLALGLEAGFNSKSSFIAAFKKFTGITPSQYRKNLSKSTN